MHSPTWREFLLYWMRFGLVSFGGPAAQISILHQDVVEKRKWLDEDEFGQALAFVSVLPGPEAHQIATYIGRKHFGVLGGVVAGSLFLFPALILISGISWLYLQWSVNTNLSLLLDGLRAGVLALIAFTAYRLAKKVKWSKSKAAFALIAMALLVSVNLPILALVFGAIMIGALTAPKQTEKTKETSNTWAQVLKPIIWGVGIWLASLALVFNIDQLRDIALLFTQAALITFGGAYSVVPFVAQAAVNDYGWLTNTQMLDGLALGESTPGPLIMINAFVGFIAYKGFIGALTATWFTFLPSTVLVFAGAPLLNALTHNQRMKNMLTWLSVAVVTFVLGFGWSVISSLEANHRFLQLAIAALGFIALVRTKMHVTLVLFGATAVYAAIGFALSF